MKSPLISVVIPTFNRAEYLRKCLHSVRNVVEHDYPNVEIIVADGGSTDNTAEVVDTFSGVNLIYISGIDQGAADAVNKGIRTAHGEIIRYFSDDDEMISGETQNIIRYFCDNPDIDVVGGQASYYKDDGLHPLYEIYPQLAAGEITKDNLPGENKSITHESLFFRRSLFDKIGDYDTSYKFCFDVEMIWRIVMSGRKIVITDKLLAKRVVQPSSNSQIHGKENFKEFARIYFKYRAWKNLLRLFWHAKWKRMCTYPIVLAKKHL